MVGIQGVGGIPEPKPERPAKVRDKENSAIQEPSVRDDAEAASVVISSEAQAAAKLATTLQIAQAQTDVRAERVTAARERMDRGDYRNPEVVAKVAERISKYLP